jgi:LacI family transcriptional regulator
MIETLQRLIARRKVDGFILTRTEVEDPRIAFLSEQGFPFVTHGRSHLPDTHAWFDIDNEKPPSPMACGISTASDTAASAFSADR